MDLYISMYKNGYECFIARNYASLSEVAYLVESTELHVSQSGDRYSIESMELHLSQSGNRYPMESTELHLPGPGDRYLVESTELHLALSGSGMELNEVNTWLSGTTNNQINILIDL